MSDSPTGVDKSPVGVVGEPTMVPATVREHAETVYDEPAAVLESDPGLVMAVGEAAVLDLLEADVDVPILPVEAGAGLGSVPSSVLEEFPALLEADLEFVDRRVLAATVGGIQHRVLLDVVLMTDEPARISEYTLFREGRSIDRFRADGIVITTPAGSTGYARAAEGPVLAPGTDVVAAVPIAPFAIDTDAWILPAGSLAVRVERDDTAVEVRFDGRAGTIIGSGETVEIRPAGTVTFATTDLSRPFFD